MALLTNRSVRKHIDEALLLAALVFLILHFL